ncbi:DUF6891 domain-containing protein [Actinophytocola sp.]|uniref:DUF6891 domain-containing protein n=1 Tax=Actinophytocola sp. TaxID=1872138 RepID=UPI002ED17DB0
MRPEDLASALVDGGLDREYVVETVVESFRDTVSEDEVIAVVDRLVTERDAEQAGWPDSGPVLDALAALSDKGIVMRADFTCCGSCGAAEIGAEAGDDDRGYVFFHHQDTEIAATGGGLMLSYGTFDGTDPTVVGREVVEAVVAAGAEVKWNGSASRFIHVTPLRWRR